MAVGRGRRGDPPGLRPPLPLLDEGERSTRAAAREAATGGAKLYLHGGTRVAAKASATAFGAGRTIATRREPCRWRRAPMTAPPRS